MMSGEDPMTNDPVNNASNDVPNAARFCEQCGARVNATARFCGSCGTALRSGGTATSRTARMRSESVDPRKIAVAAREKLSGLRNTPIATRARGIEPREAATVAAASIGIPLAISLLFTISLVLARELSVGIIDMIRNAYVNFTASIGATTDVAVSNTTTGVRHGSILLFGITVAVTLLAARSAQRRKPLTTRSDLLVSSLLTAVFATITLIVLRFALAGTYVDVIANGTAIGSHKNASVSLTSLCLGALIVFTTASFFGRFTATAPLLRKSRLFIDNERTDITSIPQLVGIALRSLIVIGVIAGIICVGVAWPDVVDGYRTHAPAVGTIIASGLNLIPWFAAIALGATASTEMSVALFPTLHTTTNDSIGVVGDVHLSPIILLVPLFVMFIVGVRLAQREAFATSDSPEHASQKRRHFARTVITFAATMLTLLLIANFSTQTDSEYQRNVTFGPHLVASTLLAAIWAAAALWVGRYVAPAWIARRPERSWKRSRSGPTMTEETTTRWTERRDEFRNRNRRIRIVLAVVLLLSLIGGTVVAAQSVTARSFSPEQHVRDYVAALRKGNAKRVIELTDASSEQREAITTMLQDSKARDELKKTTSVKVSRASSASDDRNTARVRITYKATNGEQTETFVLKSVARSNTLGILKNWHIDNAIHAITVTEGSGYLSEELNSQTDVRVNGLTPNDRGEITALRLYPFHVTSQPQPHKEAIDVTEPADTAAIRVTRLFSGEFQKKALDAVAAHITKSCTAPDTTTLQQQDCPFTINNSRMSDITIVLDGSWANGARIDPDLNVSIDSINAEAEYTDSFTSTRITNYDVRASSVRYSLKLEGDNVNVTPQRSRF